MALQPATAGTVAVYVHWPWCASLCPYCDFDKQATDFRLAEPYAEALIQHLEATPRRTVHSLYFGGGTPSLLRPDRLARIIAGVGAHMDVQNDWEVTLEANPSDVVPRKVEGYLQAGVNRISLGVQSLVDRELQFLGRRHDADKAMRAARALREAGCVNFSVDLMYGLPGQSQSDLDRSIEGLVALEPSHISCYALTLEAETPMGADAAAGRLEVADDDRVADAYARIQEKLGTAGFDQYELSNWARPGRQSVHNLTYWRNGEYLGLGAGASGSFMGLRYKRTPIVPVYIESAARGGTAYVEIEPWTTESRMRDTVMLGLRLSEGIADAEFVSAHGLSLAEYCTDRLGDLTQAGVLQWHEGRLALAPSYYLVSNAVLADILPGLA